MIDIGGKKEYDGKGGTQSSGLTMVGHWVRWAIPARIQQGVGTKNQDI